MVFKKFEELGWREFMILVLMFIIIFLIVLLIESDYQEERIQEEYQSIISEDYIIRKCHNLSLRETADCLVKYVNYIFKYNVTPDEIDLSFEELKDVGGDCRDWNIQYMRFAKLLGFNGFSYPLVGHRIAIIQEYPKGSYCVLDQRSVVGCGYLKSE